MRKFYLESNVGERLPLQGGPLFFHQPEGLGFMDAREYFEAQYGFHHESNKIFEQPNIVGTLVFLRGDKYSQYSDLVQWLHDSAPLRLVYVPVGTRDEQYMDVDVEGLEKSEITPYGTLEVPISMRGKSPYYFRNPREFVFTNKAVSNPKKYPYQYSYRYSVSVSGDVIEFTARGHFPAAFELYANGPISHPVLTAQSKYGGEVYGVLDLTDVVLEEGEQIYWSSRPNEIGVWKISGDTRTDLIDVINLANNNFFTVPASEIIRISFDAEIDPVHLDPIIHTLRLHEYMKG